jgi:hypothetical protein
VCCRCRHGLGCWERGIEQLSVCDYLKMVLIRVPCMGPLGVWLMPLWLSMEDIRLASSKDRVDVSSCLTQLIVQVLDPCMRQGLSLNTTSYYISHL